MKKITFILFLIFATQITKAQDASVEKSIFGIQTGFLGAWGYNESKLSNEFTLRTEVGLDLSVFDSFFIPGGTQTVLTPVSNLEPRWYYNLNKRQEKGKKIANNSGNFFSLKFSYHPDLFVISSQKNITIPNQISVIPTWGIRRTIGKSISYETGFGLGYGRILDDIIGDKGEVRANIHLRIGFDF
jgi:hypothetical protein